MPQPRPNRNAAPHRGGGSRAGFGHHFGGAQWRPGIDIGGQIGTKIEDWGSILRSNFEPKSRPQNETGNRASILDFYMGPKMRSHFKPGK